MPKLPLVAIIGRPNTGKSTLFNRMVGSRQAIISETPGTTRDHVATRIQSDELDYLLVDTGGMGGGTEDKDFEDDVHAQSLLALSSADVILFTVNSREDLTKSDHQIVELLRKNRRRHVPVIVVLTKADNQKIVEEAYPEIQSLGISEEIFPVSALNNLGTAVLEERIITHLHKLHFKKETLSHASSELPPSLTSYGRAGSMTTPRIAIVGKPNVGKSSLVNALMSDTQKKESPRLVSSIAGTTRDATDTIIKYHDEEFIFVDTAGLKKQSKTDEGIESYAELRTIQALEQSDIAVIVLEATQEIARQDKRIASLAAERGKGMILLLNKIDLVSKEERAKRMEEIEVAFQFCRFAKVLPVSTQTREGILKMFEFISMIQRNRVRRIATKDLQRWFSDAVVSQPLGPISKSKHITQADAVPPTFVIFVKNPKEVRVSQLRYLDNRLRETFDFQGTPVRWVTKGPREV